MINHSRIFAKRILLQVTQIRADALWADTAFYDFTIQFSANTNPIQTVPNLFSERWQMFKTKTGYVKAHMQKCAKDYTH